MLSDTAMRTLCSFVGLALVSSAIACSGSAAEEAEDSGEFGEVASSELRSRSLLIPSGGSKAFTFSVANAGPVALTVDCAAPANPDALGNVFSVDAPALHLPANEGPKAAYFAWSGDVEAGTHTVTLNSVQGGGRCAVKVGRRASGACTAHKTSRSPNMNHTHFAVGQDTSSDWEPFPASGNHWGAWATWNKAYSTPVKRAFALHNMEHGGSVLSYKCASPTESPDCQAAEQKLKDLVSSTNLTRYLITPDPDQPEMFAVRTWRMAHTSSCFDRDAAAAFLDANMRRGREDIDADPPLPFDPTTTEVPCQNLMAAPDSCF